MHTLVTMIAIKARWLVLLSTVLLVGLALSACEGVGTSTPTAMVTMQPSKPAATASPTTSPSPTPTVGPSLTPTVNPTTGPSPTPAPTPPFDESTMGYDILFGGASTTCNLPCWNDLVVGQSKSEDIQKMFETVFGFEYPPDPLQKKRERITVPGIIENTYQWNLGNVNNLDTFFFATFWFEQKTHILQGINLFGSHEDFLPYTSPQHVIGNLGTPALILVTTDQTAKPDVGLVDLLIIYDEGVAIFYPSTLAKIEREPQVYDKGRLELCLDRVRSTSGPVVDIYMLEPFTKGLQALTPMQNDLIGIDTLEMKTFQEVFDLSLEEVGERAKQNASLCVYANIP